MTTFAEIKTIMNQNGWESISPQIYQEEKRKKHITARISSLFFRLKQDKSKELIELKKQICIIVDKIRELEQ